MNTAASDPNIMKLAEEVAKLLAKKMKKSKKVEPPTEIDLWDADTIATYLMVTPRQVTERIVVMPDFPNAIRLPTITGSKGHPRWKAVEVIAWVHQYRERRAA